ncbi:MAG TPA: YegP family protein [Micrococcaceae bacterium]|nr:YegP family protein [Micrococcaceae bacterium]
MASNIELFLDEESQYRFNLLDPEGNILAVSSGFPTREAAAAGIYTVRECAGTALVSDNTGSIPKIKPKANA